MSPATSCSNSKLHAALEEPKGRGIGNGNGNQELAFKVAAAAKIFFAAIPPAGRHFEYAFFRLSFSTFCPRHIVGIVAVDNTSRPALPSVTFGLVGAQKCTRLLKIQQLIAGTAYKAAEGKTTREE